MDGFKMYASTDGSAKSAPPHFIRRHLQRSVLEALEDTPSVFINGPRQSGKTTLVRQCGEGVPYLSLDDPTRLAAARSEVDPSVKTDSIRV